MQKLIRTRYQKYLQDSVIHFAPGSLIVDLKFETLVLVSENHFKKHAIAWCHQE